MTGTTTAGAEFTLAAATGEGVGIGTAVKIPGAGAGGTNLVGVIKNVDNLSATVKFVLGDPATGLDLPCLTNVTSVTMTFMPAWTAGVYPLYRVSSSLNFPSVAAQSHQNLTISAPSGVTLTTGKACYVGIDGTPPTGLMFFAYVTSGGLTVTVRAVNYTAAAIDPGAITFTVFVEA